MRKLNIPYNLYPLDARGIENKIPQIVVLDTFVGATKNFHPNGLYSNEIFGTVGTKRRMGSFAYIYTKLPIIHPIIYNIVIRAKAFYKDIIVGKSYAIFNATTKDFEKSNAVDGHTGYEFFIKHIKELKLPDTNAPNRKDGLALFYKSKDVYLTDKVLVLPAGMRDYTIDESGHESSDEINSLYYKLLAVANTVNIHTAKMAPETYNTQRVSLQNTFNSIYTYITDILRGKRGFIAKKWMARAITYGTRNVITSNVEPITSLDDESVPGLRDKVMGLYQACKAILPVTIYQLKIRFLEKVFQSPIMPAILTDPNTLKAVEVKVDSATFSQYMSNEGLEKFTSILAEESLRHNPIMVNNHYLGLCYKNNKNQFAFINGVDELPFDYTPDQVTPITYAELVYYALYPVINKYHSFFTRYPVTGVGSTFPCRLYLKTTDKVEKLTELDTLTWEIAGLPNANQFPVKDSGFFNAMSIHASTLDKSGADFDGDMGSANATMSLEANNEIEEYYNSAISMVGTDNQFINSLATETVNFVTKHMCRGA